jgi:hypothetical protein
MDASRCGQSDSVAADMTAIGHDTLADQWEALSPLERSAWVINWCDAHDVPCPFLATQLTRAMAVWPSEFQGPAHYLAMILAGTALLIPPQKRG